MFTNSIFIAVFFIAHPVFLSLGKLLLWFQYYMSTTDTCSWILDSQVVALFTEILELICGLAKSHRLWRLDSPSVLTTSLTPHPSRCEDHLPHAPGATDLLLPSVLWQMETMSWDKFLWQVALLDILSQSGVKKLQWLAFTPALQGGLSRFSCPVGMSVRGIILTDS